MRPAACHTPPTPCLLHSQLQLTTSLPNTSPCVIYDGRLILICVKIVCTDNHLRVAEGICTELALFVKKKMRAKRTLRTQQATASYRGDSNQVQKNDKFRKETTGSKLSKRNSTYAPRMSLTSCEKSKLH